MTPAETCPLRVLVADDHELILDAIAHFLNAQQDIEATTASSLQEALAVVAASCSFDVVLLDYNMPGMEGLSGLEAAIAATKGQVAIMSGAMSPPLVQRALAAGARGFISKNLNARSLLNAIRFIAMGEIYVPPDLVSPAPQVEGLGSRLKPAELQVLMKLCEGQQNRDIANTLGMPETTVKMHVRSICGKIGAANRTQAAIIARREQIV